MDSEESCGGKIGIEGMGKIGECEHTLLACNTCNEIP